ncbi:MAG: c-type cytochrome [Alcanivoracaceae bacterium]|nr:c-type cytochrome [Alcanivoracaceae bacterium]
MRKYLAVLLLSSVAAIAHAGTEDQYNQSCTFCHGTGAAGAPKTGDKAAWAPRLEKGMETLVKHAREGFNAMPPKGMCNDCTDEDFRALIEHMTK